MKTLLRLTAFFATLLPMALMSQNTDALRKERDKLVDRGLWRDVVTNYQEKLLGVSDKSSGEDLEVAVKALSELGQWKEFDGLVESAVAAHPANVQILVSAASAYTSASHSGRLVGGEFERTEQMYRTFGRGRGGNPAAQAGEAVNTEYRDKIRSLQLLREATNKASEGEERLDVWKAVSHSIYNGDIPNISLPGMSGLKANYWSLQALTPLDQLPDWGEMGPEGGTEGIPWADNGPVLFAIPESWDAAKNDGERWRFAMAERERLAKELGDEKSYADSVLERAEFSKKNFGDISSSDGYFNGRNQTDDNSSAVTLDSLTDDEVLSRTSDGIRKFKLPEDQHFIALYRSLLNGPVSETAYGSLASTYMDRNQYDQAKMVLEEAVRKHEKNELFKSFLNQITGNWGRFEQTATVASGTEPVVPLVFRNATSVKISAAPVDMDAVLADTIDYLKSNPKELDWQRLQVGTVAQRLLEEDAGTHFEKHIGKEEISWETELNPKEKYLLSTTEIKVPLKKAGAWWLTAEMKDGNKFHTLVWIVDNILLSKAIQDGQQWWVAGAADGSPVAGAKIQFFGYRMIHLDRKKPSDRNMEIRTKTVEKTTDEDGKIVLNPEELDQEYQWISIARKEGQATAFNGFENLYWGNRRHGDGTRIVSYGISDRPLYKPGDTAHLKFFIRHVAYVGAQEDAFANRSGTLVLRNGRGEESVKVENLKTNQLGAVEADVVIPKDGGLGRWSAAFVIDDRAYASVVLSVEEFRKPEYEVSVEAPSEPIRLGDRFKAKVKATYFHGSPVRSAEVEITVNRESMGERWFPVSRWDWLYGSGAWWQGAVAEWHPTWRNWGCMPPQPPWMGGHRWTPDELVLKTKVQIGEDGTAEVEIDTADAKRIHGDMDARYRIEAKVVDASRREEKGSGYVIAARKPFEIAVWTDHGYTRSGDSVKTTISASTLMGKPVAGAQGTLKVLKIQTSADGKISEVEVSSQDVVLDADGKATVAFEAPEVGQYRIAVSLTYQNEEAVEGGTILNVHGSGRANPEDWHFGPLELIADKAEYAPGETAKIRVNSDKVDANVWLFLHIKNAASGEAKRMKLDGKSLEVEVPLDLNDMPNMFVEGVSVHGARVHSAVRQILLPPVSKEIQVTLEPTKDRVKPREKSSLVVKMRDGEGKPVSGDAVLTVYDKSLEAIVGGSNVRPIVQSFWDWKNHYYPAVRNSVPYSPGNIDPKNGDAMQEMPGFPAYGSYGYGSDTDPFGGSAPRAMGGPGRNADPFGGAPSEMAELSVARSAAPAAPAMRQDKMAADLADAGAQDANPIQVRSDFADLLKWSGAVKLDEDGYAEIPLEFPDNLTTWKARVWMLTAGSHVGEGTAEIITSKELLVRLQAPRFLVERDEAVLSAVVQNDHTSAKTVKVSLELEGGNLEAIDGGEKTVEIAANSEARVDWKVKAIREGEATLRMRADAGDDGDAVERKLPVLVHGMLRQDAWSRTVDPEAESTKIIVDVPEQRRVDQSKLTVRFSPSVAGAVVDAIPYLVSYPHGCTEQTLNRFVPAVIAQKMLRDMKVDLAQIREKRANLNPQELGNAKDRAAQWEQWKNNPVFDDVEMEKMIQQGIDKLMSMQNGDGGWGWFSGYQESSYPHTTSVVVHGLLVARENGAKVPEETLNAGLEWLVAYERRQTDALQLHVERQALRNEGKTVKPDGKYEKGRADSLDAFVRMVLGEAKRDSEPMLAFLHRDRLELPVYAQCLLGLEHHRRNDEARRDEVILMVSQYLKRDGENQTVYLDLRNTNYWWYWYGSNVEAHAWFLKLLTAAKPDHEDTRGIVKYLVNNRKNSTYWESTRDTAYAVEAIANYFTASGESSPEMEVEVLVNGKSERKVAINRENLFSFDGTVVLSGDAVTTGKHEIEIRRAGKGTVYANAYLQVFTLEDKLRAAGLEVKVSRKVYKLVPLESDKQVPDSSGLITTQKVERFRKEPLEDGAKVSSGDRIEVELILESKNDYEYLLFSDAKAAGFEAVDALSGYVGGGRLGAYMEPRDKTVDFFIRSLSRGTHTLHYELRAEAPGVYKALPAIAEAMYAPELRANSEDIRLEIAE